MPADQPPDHSRDEPPDEPLPRLWLLSDARNDALLESALARLPRGGGFIYRHYHLPPPERHARFRQLARLARARSHLVILAGPGTTAHAWGADGIYAPPRALGPRRAGLLRLATAHDLREIARARRAGAHAVLLSPVFPTRSHPGASSLGPIGFRLLAARAGLPVIALGGMTCARARRLAPPGEASLHWAAIDGLVR